MALESLKPGTSDLKKNLLTTDELVELFRAECLRRNMEEESTRRYISCFGIFLDFLKERNVFVLEVTKKELEEFIDYRRGHGGKHGDGVSEKTLENDFAAISSFYDFAEYKEYVAKEYGDPCSQALPP